MLLSIACLVFFAAAIEARYWAEDCEVSQVFKLLESHRLPGGNYAGVYNVAVTPLTAQDKMAQICDLYTITPVSYLNLLDKKVWLFPLHEFQFAYYETPDAKRALYWLLAAGVSLLIVAYVLFHEKET